MDGDGNDGDGDEAVRERESVQHRFDAKNDPEPGGGQGMMDGEPESRPGSSVPENDPLPRDAAPDSDKP